MSGNTAPFVTSIQSLTFDQAKPHLIPLLPDADRTHHADLARLEALWPDLTATATSLENLVQSSLYLITDPTQDYSDTDTEILIHAHHLLHTVYDTLSAVTQWNAEILPLVITRLTEVTGTSIETPVRVATTAQTTGPNLARILAALGQNETLRRLKVCLHHIHNNGGHH